MIENRYSIIREFCYMVRRGNKRKYYHEFTLKSIYLSSPTVSICNNTLLIDYSRLSLFHDENLVNKDKLINNLKEEARELYPEFTQIKFIF